MDLYSKLSACMEELSQTFTSRMAQYEEDLKNASSESTIHKSVASLSREFIEFKGVIWKAVSALRSQMELLVLAVDRHEMSSRSKVLLLHGLTEDKSIPPTAQFLGIVSQKLNMSNITPINITVCHYLGSNLSKPRPLLVRFESRKLRNEVWQNKANLKGTGLTLSEFLTKPRHEMFMSARRYYGVNRCWTSDGKIVVQVSAKTRRRVESAAELRSLMVQFPLEDNTSEDTAITSKTTHQACKTTTSTVDKRSRKHLK